MGQDTHPGNERPRAIRASTFMGKEAFKTHLLLVVCLALCALAFWFEVGRAERGNELSWAYVFEWPLLGGFAIYMWWKFLHPVTKQREPSAKSEKVAHEYAGMLAAWQESQRKLERERQDEERASPARKDNETDRFADP